MKTIISIAISLLVSACATTNFSESKSPQKCYLEKGEPVDCYSRPRIGGSNDETAFETAFSHEPWFDAQNNKRRPNIGIASGGGGTKASSFSMGVIKRLVDDDNIKNVDIISSVSGGGHPISYLYAKARYAQLMDVADCPAAEAEGAKAAVAETADIAEGHRNKRDFIELQCMYLHLSQIQLKFPQEHYNYLDLPTNNQILAIPTNDLISAGLPDNRLITDKMQSMLFEGKFTQVQHCIKDSDGECASEIATDWEWDGLHEPEFKCFTKKSSKLLTLNNHPGIDTKSAHRAFTWNRCSQDMASRYSSEVKAVQSMMWFKRVGAFGVGASTTALSLPFHHTANTLFDWQIDLSPIYYIQKNGNEKMGLWLPDGKSDDWLNNYDGSKTIRYFYAQERVEKKCEYFKETDLNSSLLNFTDLKCAEQLGLPMWIINATTPTRSLLDFRRTELADMDEYRFEFTPYGFGSHKYGFLKNDENEIDIYARHGLSLPKAMSSSYAFADGRQRVMANWPMGLNSLSYAGIEAGAHALNLNWSISIPNYNMKKSARTAYHFLPAPFNYYSRLDEQAYRAHIPLADGGINRDGLGILPLLERRTKNIIVINQGSSISDLCQFSAFLKGKGRNLEFVFYGDPRIVGTDTTSKNVNLLDEGLCTQDFWDQNPKLKDEKKLNPKAWTLPVWKGEIRTIGSIGKDKRCTLTDDIADSSSSVCTKIFFIMSNMYTQKGKDPDEYCMSQLLKASGHKDLVALVNKSGQVSDITESNPNHMYPPSLCGWLHENSKSEFPAHGMFFMTIDSSQDLGNAYMDLGWFLAGGLSELFEDPK